MESDLTLEVGLVSRIRSVADHHTGCVDHDRFSAPQSGLDLPRAPALLQPQHKQVVMTTEADQDPLPDVDPLAGEPQGVGAVSEVGANREVTLHDLREGNHLQNQIPKLHLTRGAWTDLQHEELAGIV